MAILEGDLQKMQIEELTKKSIVSERLLTKIATNINELIKRRAFGVGDVLMSELSEANFQTEHDNTWVLCNGQNIENSLLATITGQTTAPDLRGRFLVQANTENTGFNPSRAVNTTAPNSNKYHAHLSMTLTGGPAPFGIPSIGAINSLSVGRSTGSNAEPNVGTSGLVVGGVAGTEARPKNISYNFFIKVDE